MEITGRLTADAMVKAISGERKVVNFSIAINDSYRSGGEQKKITTYFDCSYWLNTGIAEYLKKGGWVQLYGRVGVNAYINGGGEAKASFTFHTSEVKILGAIGSISNGRGSVSGSESGVKTGAPKSRSERDSKVRTEKTQVGNVGTFEGIDGDIPF